MNVVEKENSNKSDNMISFDRYSALLAVSRFEKSGDLDKANRLLGIIARSIAEDKLNYFSTSLIRLLNSEELSLFEGCSEFALERYLD